MNMVRDDSFTVDDVQQDMAKCDLRCVYCHDYVTRKYKKWRVIKRFKREEYDEPESDSIPWAPETEEERVHRLKWDEIASNV
jgi:pyruvate-formate lyase-activating enzyme